MNPPLVSVIMSVYNAEKFLNSAIESITNQTFTDFEFIIIEDCSTDKTLEILKELKEKDNRIKIIQKEKNEGPKGFKENTLQEWMQMIFLCLKDSKNKSFF